jgi:hypothetical protein
MLEDVMDTQYEAINWRGSKSRASSTPRASLAGGCSRAAEQTANRHTWLERQLGDRPWFNGVRSGWGDAAVAPHLNFSAAFSDASSPESRLGDWLKGANERPSVVAAAAAARARMEGGPDLVALVASGRSKRQYRDHRLEWMLRSGGVPIVLDGIEKGAIRFGNELA